MRLLGKEWYSLSLWSVVLQGDLYIQGCKNSVLLPGLFFLKPTDPEEIICLWNFHFLNASLPRVLPVGYEGPVNLSPQAFPFPNTICEQADCTALTAGGLSANGPREALVIHGRSWPSLFFPKLSASSQHNDSGIMLCARCWAFCGGLVECPRKGVTISQVGQTERSVDRGQEVVQGQHELRGMAERLGSHMRGGDGGRVRWEGWRGRLALWR